MVRQFRGAVFPLIVLIAASAAIRAEDKPFAIRIVDAATGRGVPLVELRTVSEMRFLTDSNGLIAFNEPGLMDRDVFFHIKSHGYAFPKDGFGNAGKALRTTPGGSADVKIQRVNIAERLYRITGEGIYRDSVILGRPVPLKNPVLSGGVGGQDSVQLADYKGKYYWFYGDTNRVGYPLGHFGTSGATSIKPENGGPKIEQGIDLEYFTDPSGFSRPMCPWPEPGPKWIEGLMVVKDEAGAEKMVARCSRMKDLGTTLDRSLIVFDDESASFKPVKILKADAEPLPTGHAFPVKADGRDWIYFATPIAEFRVPADYKSAIDPAAYESFTCLKKGESYAKGKSVLDRGADGKLVWGWKAGTESVNQHRQKELIKAKVVKPDEAWHDFVDAESGKPIDGANGTIHFNAYRKRWIMIFNQQGGTSMLGEVWYSEAAAPEGPWAKARKIVTHENYTFYNLCHHPQFDQEGGRVIYFEGTYTTTFSGNTNHPTPRYEYNQMMYRLDLADPRLKLVN